MSLALFTALLVAVAPAQGSRSAKKPPRDPRLEGLGRSCKVNKDCRHKSQRCIHESDANGKPIAAGFCVLPCASFESGTAKVVPGEQVGPITKKEAKKKPPPRCPANYECRSAGAGVPLDMCVKK
ncbi:MAG TPA: hypothetical protein VLW85_04140 [Myxococcales bacterium]|nr:hypothetical protein [Myxococcales bacterium]